jgi:hypothetical protein
MHSFFCEIVSSVRKKEVKKQFVIQAHYRTNAQSAHERAILSEEKMYVTCKCKYMQRFTQTTQGWLLLQPFEPLLHHVRTKLV